MLRKIVAAVVVCAALCGTASAGGVDAFFGNTVVTTIEGASTRWQFNPDRSFTFVAPDGAAGAGAWTFSAGSLCVTPAGGETLCTVLPDGKGVGDQWQATNDHGQTFVMAIEAGR